MANLFIEEINQVAKANKISITALAKFIGCSRVTFYNWLKESGQQPMPMFDAKVRELHDMLTTTATPKETFQANK